MCPKYGRICNSGASGKLPVGVMCIQAGEHNEVTLSKISVACCMMLRKVSMMSNSANIMPGF